MNLGIYSYHLGSRGFIQAETSKYFLILQKWFAETQETYTLGIITYCMCLWCFTQFLMKFHLKFHLKFHMKFHFPKQEQSQLFCNETD